MYLVNESGTLGGLIAGASVFLARVDIFVGGRSPVVEFLLIWGVEFFREWRGM